MHFHETLCRVCLHISISISFIFIASLFSLSLSLKKNPQPQTHKIKLSYKSLAAIPTNTLLLDQQVSSLIRHEIHVFILLSCWIFSLGGCSCVKYDVKNAVVDPRYGRDRSRKNNMRWGGGAHRKGIHVKSEETPKPSLHWKEGFSF